MIQVRVALSLEGAVLSLEATGHAGFQIRGTDIVCSAVTALLRTFLALTETLPGWEGESSAVKEGCLVVNTRAIVKESAWLYTGYSWFVLRGLEDLVRDFPGQVELIIHKTTGRLFHGT